MGKPVKMTGAEYTEFTAEEWGPDWYWDETLFTHNGVEKDDIGEVEPTDEIVILDGTLFKGQQPNSPSSCALAFARKWLKDRVVTTLQIEVPKDQVDAFRADMKSKGLRVL